MAKKIIIADDEERVRKLIRKILEMEDKSFLIYETQNGDETLKLARKTKPHLLILDVMMPGMTGYDVCKALKNSAETKDIYVLIVTAREGKFAENTMKIVGADALLSKPFTTIELTVAVKKAFWKFGDD